MGGDSDSDFAPPEDTGSKSSKAKKTSKKSTPSKRKKSTPSKKAGKKRKSPAPKTKNSKKKPPKKSQKAATLSWESSLTQVKDYLLKQNRPYSHTQIFDNLHSTVKKSMVPTVLEALSKEGDLICQEFGKTKLYYPNQSNFETVSAEKMKEIDEKIGELKKDHAELQTSIKNVTADIGSLEASLTDEQLEQSLEKAAQQLEEKRVYLQQLKENQTCFSKDKLNEMDRELRDFVGHWKKKRRAVTDMVGVFLENCSMKKKKLQDKIGLELDESAETMLSEISQMVPR
eukprot:jgi/Bigna1/127548/aug1.4_g2256